MDVMDAQLRPWGIDWFQVDDGYQIDYGDWTWNKERFPHGPRWLSDQIRDAGFKPGLWMAPFTAHDGSAMVVEHPDWFVEPTQLGELFVSDHILDLTHPEVLAWLTELGRTVREDWGFDWLKLDFGYYALFGDQLYDSQATREQAWHRGLQALRDGLGEDTFLLMVGPVGLNYAQGDSGRLTLDTMPVWDSEPGASTALEPQGFKPTVRAAGRRWYLQDRVWVNHPDLLLFRSNTRDESWPRVTYEESRALCSFVGLSGGIVKLGDRLLDLDAPAIDAIRRLIPSFGVAARPLDVFTREYPEVWQLDVTDPEDGLDDSWTVLGLFHWGSNLDLSTSPYQEIPDTDAPRMHTLDLEELGLGDGEWLAWEFWTASSLGRVSGTLSVEVPSHDSRVVALRRPQDHPSFLGWNRQITMGGVLVEDAAWDEAAAALTFRAQVAAPTEAAPFTYVVAFHTPDGAPAEITADGAEVDAVDWDTDGEITTARFVPAEDGALTLTLRW